MEYFNERISSPTMDTLTDSALIRICVFPHLLSLLSSQYPMSLAPESFPAHDCWPLARRKLSGCSRQRPLWSCLPKASRGNAVGRAAPVIFSSSPFFSNQQGTEGPFSSQLLAHHRQATKAAKDLKLRGPTWPLGGPG